MTEIKRPIAVPPAVEARREILPVIKNHCHENIRFVKAVLNRCLIDVMFHRFYIKVVSNGTRPKMVKHLSVLTQFTLVELW